MRKSLMMVCCATFMAALCVMPIMYAAVPPGPPPPEPICPKTKVSHNPANGLCTPDPGTDVTDINANGNQIKGTALFGCPQKEYPTPAQGQAACEGKKLATFIRPDYSKTEPNGSNRTYTDVNFNPLLGAIPVMTSCCDYVYCTWNGTDGICELGGSRNSYQIDYIEKNCPSRWTD